MITYHQTPLLQSKTSKGLRKFWQGFAITDGTDYYTRTCSYQEKADGQPSSEVWSIPARVQGKNIGRANETTPRDQAILEITSNMNKKRDKGYHEEGEEIDSLPLPMLAHDYNKRAHDIDWTRPVYVQPKLDGTRMLFDGKKGWSRQGKLYLDEVISHLKWEIPEGFILDGELMLDQNEFTFQETISAIKKFRPETSPKLQFHVYDICNHKMPFKSRMDRLQYLLTHSDCPKNIIPVLTEEVEEIAQVKKAHRRFTEAGYEGVMIRNADGFYKFGNRSADLQKYKHFQDDEYEIIRVVDGVGKEEGCAIFFCRVGVNQEVKVRPRGTLAYRQELWANKEDLIGKKLTVRFQELTDDGIPRFPVGIAIRDYE